MFAHENIPWKNWFVIGCLVSTLGMEVLYLGMADEAAALVHAWVSVGLGMGIALTSMAFYWARRPSPPPACV